MRLLVVLALVLGCKGREATPSRPTGSATPTAASKAPISEADARGFAEKLVADLVPTCDETTVAARIGGDHAAVVARLLCEWLKGISDYKLIGVRNIGGQVHPITRRLLTDPDTEAMFVNYD